MGKTKDNFEIRRQVFHLLFGAVIVMLLKYMLIDEKIILLLIVIGFVVSYISKTRKIPIIYHFLKRFERNEEIKIFPGKGVITYLIGILIVLVIPFSREIALASILVLAFGDSVSHLFGLHYGKTKTLLSDKKFLEGSLAGFVAAFIGAKLFLLWHEAFFASLIAMVFETTGIRFGSTHVDDILFMPFIAAMTVWVIRYFF